MPQACVRRCAAVALLVVLGGGFALPGLDELLYHRLPARAGSNVAHIDQPGGCDSHAEHCVAAPLAYAPRLAASPSPAVPMHAADAQRGPAILTSDPRSTDRQTPQQPRAPPTA
jgi:hypothetical protein